mmetsp:Transcript_8532/g.20638  ORF Transcript_8532/g.20638 Transcript_8532/m.20638 type:complete len:1930 (-) Transcript_8532:626-6415(-)|eukprot:CAMPEP_0178998954 /NCGR_PEP_ID=MMETSP0795-20121207/9787_1 /TAXON_ID=88552 /ORGANISM="Amoebophrya sp., Strain Ameob2" /LENGTH=1929 /DNA_ID=CAMNT_0020691665 /DNA_START=577 /DNA_END=6366 /DNA_ORIENTATION=-
MTKAESSSIGSFRGAGPDDGMEDVSLLFEEPLAGMVRTLVHVGDHDTNKPLPPLHAAANRDLITDLLAPADLNVGAFGRAYADCEEFGEHLRRFASLNPDVFYDQALMPLLQRSYAIADRFFGCSCGGGGASSTAQVAFVPNCSHGMKAVLDTLVLDGKHTEIAYLDPLYPATAALLQYLEKMSPQQDEAGGGKVLQARAIPLLLRDHDEEGDRDSDIKQNPAAEADPDSGINHSLFAEEANVFVNSLEAAWRENAFTVLVADEVASQTGRVLPLEEVACWCEEKGVLLVVDGTQSADYFQEKFFGGGDEVPAPGHQGGTFVPKPRLHPVDAVGRGLKRKLRFVDYYVLSTHKWLGNVKTAGVVRWRTSSTPKSSEKSSHAQKVVLPPTRVSAVSFGFDKYLLAAGGGEDASPQLQTPQLLRESFFLWAGMGAQYVPYITLGKALLLFAEFGQRQLQHATDLLQKGLSLIPEGSQLRGRQQVRVPMAVIRVQNVRERFFPEYPDDKPITATAFQNKLQKDFGVFVSVKPVDDKISVCGGGGTSSGAGGGGQLCEFRKRGSGNANEKLSKSTPTSESFYLRLSVWSGNSIAEFEKLRDVLTCNVNLKTMLQLLAIAYCPYPTTTAMQKAVKEDLLHSSSPEKVGFEVSAEDALAPAAEKNNGAEAAKATDATSTRKPSKPHDPTQHSRTAAAAFYATYLRAPTEGERVKALAQFKAVLKHQFLFTFGLYERLFSTLKTEALFFRAERLRHHLIFYLGHTAVFYWNKLVSAGWVAASDRINPKFEAIFAVGVDEMSWDDLLEENYDWCGFSEEKQEEYRGAVEEYRGLVKESVCALIDGYGLEDADRVSSSREGEGASGAGCPENAGLMRAACGKLLSQQIVDKYNAVAGGGGARTAKNFSTSINASSTSDCLAKTLQDTMLWIFLMGTEHEKIHQETSCCIISQMPLRMLRGTDDEKMRWLYPLNQSSNHQPNKSSSQNRLVPVAGGAVAFGKTNDAVEKNYYGWDNEFDGEVAHLSPFEVSEKLVSNAEYLEFMNENGYGERKYWTDEGWRFVRDLNVSRPRWWLNADNEEEIKLGRPLDSSVTKAELDTWLEQNKIKNPTSQVRNFKYRAMLSVIPMPWEWPVEVNNLEAAAFCKWKAAKLNKPNLRLLGHPEQVWLAQNAKKHNSNLNLTQGASPTPVDDERNAGYVVEDDTMNKRTGKPEKTIQKLYDVTGNVWRHSCSVLTLMPGFKPHRAYDDFTLPTIDGEHNFILGGSWTSLGNCANVGSRYGFRRHFYQYAGIRYVNCAVEVGGPGGDGSGNNLELYTDQNLASGAIHTTAPRIHAATPLGVKLSEHYYELYETPNAHLGMDEDVARYLGTEDKVLSNWPRFLGEVGVAVVGKMQEALKLTPGTRNKLEILVVHGSVGRSSLELLKGCENVSITHTDNTANLLQPFEEVLLQGRVQWRQTVEGEICDTREYYLPEPQMSLDIEAKNNSISLVQIPDYQTSLNKLPENKKFDLVIADFRYLSCEAEIEKLAERLESGNGVMLLATLQEMSSVHFHSVPANGGGSAGEKNNGCTKIAPDDGFLESAVRAEKLGFYRSIGDTEPERVKSVWRGGRERGFAHLEKQTKHKHQFWRSYLSCWKAPAASALDSTATTSAQPLPAQPDESESLSRGASGALVNHNQKTTQYYQDDDILSSYYQFHYGDLLAPKTSSLQTNVGNFPAATAAFCLEMCEKYLLPPTIKASTTARSKKTLALDAGCGPGRSAFELLKGGFETVEAFDYATGFVDMLEKEKRLDPFSLFTTTSTTSSCKKQLICYQADAHKLLEVCRFPESTYDLVSGANLIDRLHSPEVFLEGCKKLVRVGGLIVHMSPYTWKPEHTEREKWVGGKFTPEMEKLFTEEALKEMHRERFEFVESRKIPFVIPDTDGSFQFTFSNAVAFRRTE